MTGLPISPLSLDPMTRDTWGSFDASIIAQLAPLAHNECYQPKIYRAPAVSAEVVAAYGYVSYGMKITPGSIIVGCLLPPSGPTVSIPGAFNVQITDTSLDHKWFDQPKPSVFLANAKLAYLSASQNVVSAFPSLFDSPYPVVGNGLFLVEIWETSGAQQRIELPFLVLEAVGAACL